MTPRTCSDWVLIAAAFGLTGFVLLSPTGSLVNRPAQSAARDVPALVHSTPPGPMAGLDPAPLD